MGVCDLGCPPPPGTASPQNPSGIYAGVIPESHEKRTFSEITGSALPGRPSQETNPTGGTRTSLKLAIIT